ncbi:hypothetical protein WCD74_01405 [Actinomycetospora sp. OC33-EN08]|uniref:DUF2029 domain-containing protein n=1 Tax=Actinomycetospora aurantiaca TaxID=3129233 RepID=A0ABU8MGF6_9PSEU
MNAQVEQRAGLLAFASIIIAVSIGTIAKNASPLIATGYALTLLVLAVVLYFHIVAWVEKHPKSIDIIAFLAIVILVIAFFTAFDPTHSSSLGAGADRSDALNVALDRLLQGQYPYYGRTYMGNEITPLPGSLLLATPFFILGDAAFQNVVWIPAFLVALNAGGRLRAAPTVVWITAVLGCAATVREHLVGDDLFVKGVYVLAAILLVLRVSARTTYWLPLVAASIALGVTLCSRPHFILMLLPICALLWKQTYSFRMTSTVAVGSTATIFVLAAPFAIVDWAGFSPLHVASKVTSSTRISPALVFLALIALVTTIGLLWWFRPGVTATMWLLAGIAAVPGALAFIQTLRVTGPDLWQLGLASPAVVFAAAAIAWKSPPSKDLRDDQRLLDQPTAPPGINPKSEQNDRTPGRRQI